MTRWRSSHFHFAFCILHFVFPPMNKLWQQLAIATNWPVLVAVGVLSSLGVISIWADDPRAGAKQAIYLCVAFGCMALFQVVNYQKLGRWAWPFYIFSFM